MIIVAHRGGNRVFPENSIAAINHSFQIGADLAEIDVRLSKDGVPIVIHDENLRRLFSINRNVRDASADELISLKYGHPNESPLSTLEFILGHCQKFPLLIHVKEENEKILPILKVIEKREFSSKVILGILSFETLHLVKKRDPNISILAFIPFPEDISRFIYADVDIIRLWDPWITRDRIDLIHRDGILAAAMTGNPGKDVGETSPERLLELKTLGMDWVFVNDVQLAARTLKHS